MVLKIFYKKTPSFIYRYHTKKLLFCIYSFVYIVIKQINSLLEMISWESLKDKKVKNVNSNFD